MNASSSRRFSATASITSNTWSRWPQVMRQAGSHLLGLISVVASAVLRPGPVVRWLSRRFPDVLFQHSKAGPLVALSFDDSPHAASTPRILDLLAEHEARATFFIIGEHLAGNEEIVRRLVDEGHELGNHMMADAPSARLPAVEFERELLQTHELLARFGPVRWFRPGHAWFNRRMLDQLHRHGYRCAMASTYALEFLPVPAPYAARHILLNVGPGGLIVLHDGVPDLERTLAVLERILAALRRRGYPVVTVSELAAAGEMRGGSKAIGTRSASRARRRDCLVSALYQRLSRAISICRWSRVLAALKGRRWRRT